MAEIEGNGKVTYTVRELLNEIKTTLTIIETKLDSKADKGVVDNMVTRLTTLETIRNSDQTYGASLIAEFRDLQKGYHSNREAITVLETSKKDKEAFNLLWIPIIINSILTLALLASRFIH